MTFWGNDIICILFFFAICFNFVLLSLFFFRKDRLEGQRVITTQSMLGRASKRAKKAEQAPCPAFLVPSYHPTSLCVCGFASFSALSFKRKEGMELLTSCHQPGDFSLWLFYFLHLELFGLALLFLLWFFWVWSLKFFVVINNCDYFWDLLKLERFLTC